MAGQDEAAEDAAEAVPAGQSLDISIGTAPGLEGLHRHLGVAVPAVEAAAVVAFAVALDVAQPEVEILRQQTQHRFVGAAAEAVAMEKCSNGLPLGSLRQPRRVKPAEQEWDQGDSDMGGLLVRRAV